MTPSQAKNLEARTNGAESLRVNGKSFEYRVEYLSEGDWVVALMTGDLMGELEDAPFLIMRTAPENLERLRNRLYVQGYVKGLGIRLKLLKGHRRKWSVILAVNEGDLLDLANEERKDDDV